MRYSKLIIRKGKIVYFLLFFVEDRKGVESYPMLPCACLSWPNPLLGMNREGLDTFQLLLPLSKVTVSRFWLDTLKRVLSLPPTKVQREAPRLPMPYVAAILSSSSSSENSGTSRFCFSCGILWTQDMVYCYRSIV